MKFPKKISKKAQSRYRKIIRYTLIGGSAIFLLLLLTLVWTKYLLLSEKNIFVTISEFSDKDSVEVFPVGVDPEKKEIIENPKVDQYAEKYLSLSSQKYRQERWFDRFLAEVTKWDFYQHLASPRSRVLVIFPGERKEEITKNFGDILRWNKDERNRFKKAVTDIDPVFGDGKFFPDRYIVDIDISPEEVAGLLNEKFTTEIISKYNEDVATKVPLKEALIIASLLEREAYDFNDMRYISGIIWNRLFIDMPLQLDATLQYVKGSNPSEPKWWPVAKPADKFTTSPFNTYKNKGLPPAPISNPSVEAIVAALNPRNTDCMFYFHDRSGGFHCSVSYEEHVANLRAVYK